MRIQFQDEIQDLRDAFASLGQALKQRSADLRHVTEVLDEGRIRNHAIFTSIGDALIVVDKNLRITRLNPVAEDLVGAPFQKLVWQPLQSVFPEFYDEEGILVPFEKWPMVKALEHRTVVRSRGFLVSQEGHRHPISVVATPFFLHGEPAGAVYSFRDISQELELERTLKEFVTVASHQLRTPLASLRWFLEMVLAGDAGDVSRKQWEFLYQAHQGAERMNELINMLLNVSRIEGRSLAIVTQPHSLVERIQMIIAEVEILFERRRQAVDFRYAASAERKIPLDSRIFEMVMENFLTNAIKYTPEKGSIAVTVEEKGDDFVIAVRDTGYGIPKDVQKKVFQKFFRSENILTRSPEGTGLGLYIAKGLVEAWGGRIWFESEENKGTAFFCTVPKKGMRSRSGKKSLVGHVATIFE